VVAFRNYPVDVSTKRVSHAIEEAWQACLTSNGAARALASYVFKLREDPSWSEEEIRSVLHGIRERLQSHGESAQDLN